MRCKKCAAILKSPAAKCSTKMCADYKRGMHKVVRKIKLKTGLR